jgi:hypothetical protein
MTSETTLTKYIPNSFQTPNALVDELMAHISDSELRVLLFLNRHILGWRNKASLLKTQITIKNFTNGFNFTKKDGTTVSMGGCGISNEKTIRKALDGLKEAGIVAEEENPGAGNTFELAYLNGSEVDLSIFQARKKKRSKAQNCQTASLGKIAFIDPLPLPSVGGGTEQPDPYQALEGVPLPSVGGGTTSDPYQALEGAIYKTQDNKTKGKPNISFPAGKAPEIPPSPRKIKAPKKLTSRAIKGAATLRINAATKKAMPDETPRAIWARVVAEQEKHLATLQDQPQQAIDNQVAIIAELKTRNPELAQAKKNSRLPSPETMPLYYAISEHWGHPPEATGRLFNLYGLLNGTAKKGDWGRCALTEPVSVDELKAYVKWRKREHPNFNLPESPELLQKSVCTFRASRTAKPVNRMELNDGVHRAAKSEQVILPHVERKMPRHLRQRHYETWDIAYDPETIVRLDAVHPEKYVQI